MVNKEQHSLPKSVFLHLLPGLIITAVLFPILKFIVPETIPKALVFYLTVLVLQPVLFFSIIRIDGRKAGLLENIEYTEKIPLFKLILFGLAALIAAIFVFIIARPLSNSLQTWAFSVIGETLDFSDYLINPDKYSKTVLIMTWSAGLIGPSILGPVFEEIYFRGYLLPRIDRYRLLTPVLGALLFSAYHIFSLWMLPVRLFATFTMIFFVWKYRNIKIGILCHVLLNVLGDSILSIPIIFK